MNNAEYWKLRFEQLEQAQNQKGVKAYADIERQYKEAQKQLEGQIARWYQRFATNNGISLAEARQYLKGADLKEFKWDVQEYIKYGQDNALNGGWMKELENASTKYHISKLEALKVQTQHSLEVKLNEKLIAEQKKALAKQQVELEAQKAAVQQQLDDFEVKTYSGIWYNKDVTTADWAGLNIEGKKKYYEGKFITETDPDLMQKYQDLYKQLEELDTEGKAYADIQKELKQIQTQITKVQADLKKLEQGGIIDSVDDAFSQERKDAAIWAKTTKEADDVLRDTCGEVWRTSPPIQKNAIYDYTQSYHKFNEPLRGIEYGSEKFLGVGNIGVQGVQTR